MANRFVIFGSKLGFDNATEEQYDENSFVIIEETEEIWVHGKIHKLVNFNIDDYLTKEDFENYKEEIEQFKGSITDIIGSGLKTINGESIVGEGNIEVGDRFFENGAWGSIQIKDRNGNVNGNNSVNLGSFNKFEMSPHSFATGYSNEVKGGYYLTVMGRYNDANNNPDAMGLKPGEKSSSNYIFMVGNGDSGRRHNALAITNFGEVFVPDVLSNEEGFEREQDVPMMSLQKKLKELEEKGIDVNIKEDNNHTIFFQDLEGNTISGQYKNPQYSVVFGQGNKLSGDFGNSQGSYNLISGKNNSVGGDHNIVGGEGNTLDYNGSYNIVNGLNNTLKFEKIGYSPLLSVVNGYGNTVSGGCNLVVGRNLITNNEYEMALGRYNESYTSEDDVKRYIEQYPNYTILSIGNNGTDENTRSNKFEIREQGDIHIADIHDPEYTELNLVKTFCLQDKLKEIEESIGNSQDLPLEKGTGDNSIQLKGCTATGSGAVALGVSCRANVEGAIALGRLANANGQGAVCLGQGSVNGSFSVSIGLNNNTYADRSVALGDETSTRNMGELSCGRCNNSVNGSSTWGSVENTLFTIGNGVWGGRPLHNAFEVRQDGTIFIPDVSAEGEYYEKPMINLQEALKKVGSGGGSSFDLDMEVISGERNILNFGKGNEIGINNSFESDIYPDEPSYNKSRNMLTFGEGLYSKTRNQVVLGKYNRKLGGGASNLDTNGYNEQIFVVGCGKSDEDRRNAFQVCYDGSVYVSNLKDQFGWKVQDLFNFLHFDWWDTEYGNNTVKKLSLGKTNIVLNTYNDLDQNTIEGNDSCSIILGRSNEVNSTYSIINGDYNRTSANNSIICGTSHQLHTMSSISVGNENTAWNGEYNALFGNGLEVYGSNSFVCGQNNKYEYSEAGEILFSVGVGEHSYNRKNGIEVRKDGHVYILNPNNGRMTDLTQKLYDYGWLD